MYFVLSSSFSPGQLFSDSSYYNVRFNGNDREFQIKLLDVLTPSEDEPTRCMSFGSGQLPIIVKEYYGPEKGFMVVSIPSLQGDSIIKVLERDLIKL